MSPERDTQLVYRVGHSLRNLPTKMMSSVSDGNLMSSATALTHSQTTAPLSPAQTFRVSGSIRDSFAFCAAVLNQIKPNYSDPIYFVRPASPRLKFFPKSTVKLKENWLPWLHQCIITGRNEVVAKVIFLHLSVILFTGGFFSRENPPARENPPGPGRPPRTR